MTIACDVDGVLRDFTKSTDALFSAETGAAIQTGEYDLARRYGDEAFVRRVLGGDLAVSVYSESRAIEGAHDFLWLLDRWSVRTGGNWLLVSSQPSALLEYLTREWVWRVLDRRAHIRFVPNQTEKHRAHADVLLDDNPMALTGFNGRRALQPHKFAVCFHREYNTQWAGQRVTRHEQLFDLL